MLDTGFFVALWLAAGVLLFAVALMALSFVVGVILLVWYPFDALIRYARNRRYLPHT